ncbi:uncharacterized protein LOC124148102 [Haliotis rufescens]|uniref:uncharacterized protein LOC124148102 n=1 Tax=Haliotis rufescens TaxID=6454 RepID=UPI00201F81B4|nr:uncharacterized protein LOC124148102 [Haliotis rufescens]
MMIFEVLIAMQFFQGVSGTGQHYCSIDDVQVDCQPCGIACKLGRDPCFRCPDECGKVLRADTCKSVCSKRCKEGICEYPDGQLKCSKGCRKEYTGSFCQEYCPEKCNSGFCDQFTSACTSNSTDHEEANASRQNMWLVLGTSLSVAALVILTTCLAYWARVKYGRKKRGPTCAIGLYENPSSSETENGDSRIHSYIDLDTDVDHNPKCGNDQDDLYEENKYRLYLNV